MRLNGSWISIAVILIGTACGISFIAGQRVADIASAPIKEQALKEIVAEQKRDFDRRFEKIEQKMDDVSDKTANKLFLMQADLSQIKGRFDAFFPLPGKRADAPHENTVR